MPQTAIELRCAKVSLATWLSSGLTILMQLISVPFCLHYWGKSSYGTWLAVTAAFALLRTIDYGHTIYVGNRLNLLYHLDKSQLRQTLAAAYWGVLLLGLVQLSILGGIYHFNYLTLLIKIPTAEPQEIFKALLIMSSGWILAATYIGIVHRLLNPAGMLYQATWMMMCLQVLQFFALLLAAKYNLSLLAAASLLTLVQLMFHLLSAIYVKQLLPDYYPWWRKAKLNLASLNILRSLPQTSFWMMTQGGANGIIIQASLILGPAAIPAFTTIMTLSNLWTMVINSLTQPLTPDTVRFYLQRDWHKLRMSSQAQHFLMLGVNLLLMLSYPLLSMIYQAWTWHQLPFNPLLLNLILAAIVANSMSAWNGTFLTAINDHAYTLLTASISGLLLLVLSWILLKTCGISGLGWAIFTTSGLNFVFSQLYLWLKIVKLTPLMRSNKTIYWSWLAAISSIFYLLSQQASLLTSPNTTLQLISSSSTLHLISWQLLRHSYWLTISLIFFCLFQAWHSLDATIKAKVRRLIEATHT